MTDAALDLEEHERRRRVHGDGFTFVEVIDDAKRSKKGAKRHAGDVVKAILYAREPIDKMFKRGTITRLQFDAGDALRNVHEIALGAGKASYLNDSGGSGFGPTCLAQRQIDASIELDQTRRAMGENWRILENVVCHASPVSAHAAAYQITEPRAKRMLDAALDELAKHYGW